MNQNNVSSAKSSQRDLGPDLSRSSNMSKIRGRDTAPEILLRKTLWHRGFRFRANFKVGESRPDIVFTSRKLVIFVDGCFWHGCPQHYVMPRTRVEFWSAKLFSNTMRDRKQTVALIESGWRVLRFWEHEVASALSEVVTQIENVFFDPSIPFRDRAIVIKVEPISSDGSLELWNIEYLTSERTAHQEIRPRKVKKSTLLR